MWWAVCLLLADILSTGSLADTEIKSLHMKTEIFHRYASTAVYSRMVNTAPEVDEASFVVTYPAAAFITKFIIESNGKVYKAKMKNKEEIEELDKEKGNDFTIFVRDSHQISVSTKVEPHGEIRFLMDYEELLPRKLGVYSNIITVNPGQIVEDLNLTVTIEEPSLITNLEVHEFQDFITVTDGSFKPNKLARIIEKSPYSKAIIWAPDVEQQKAINARGIRGQLVVEYSLDLTSQESLYVMDNLNNVAIFFAPDAFPRLKKHIIFVLDYRYSIKNQKLGELKKAMERILMDLNPNDYFSLVLIKSFVEAWSPTVLHRTGTYSMMEDLEGEHMLASERVIGPLTSDFIVEASPENVAKACKFLQIADLGGSYLIGGFRVALDLVNIGAKNWKAEDDPPIPLIIFLSDGKQHIGEIDNDATVNQVKALNINRCPIYSLGFGYYADNDFLRKLSLSNYGSSRVIYEAADTVDQLFDFYESIASPLLTNVTISYYILKVKDFTRSVFPLYFRGSEVVVAGKVRKDALAELDSIGQLSATSRESRYFCYPLTQKINFDGNSVTKLFEYLHITQMLNMLDSLLESEKREKVKQSLLSMATECTFFTTYTPLVVDKPDGSKSVVEITPLKQVPPLHKVELKKIKWLQPHLTQDAEELLLQVSVNDEEYTLALNETNTTYGPCSVNHMAGECMHFERCALEIFEDEISDYLPYKCNIPGKFLGVCCLLHVR